MKDLTPILVEHPFLKGIATEHLERIAKQARAADFDAGQVILRPNQTAYELYLINDGTVLIESCDPGADNLPLQTIAAGDVLGWSWFFPPFSSHFQARAVEPTKAIFLDGASLLVACENDHRLGYQLMMRVAQIIVRRLQATRKHLVQLQESDGPLSAVDSTLEFHSASQLGGTKAIGKLLALHPFLEGMKPAHLTILANSAMQSQFAAGQLIFREGELANRFYLIERGKVLVQFPQTDSNAVPIEIIGDGGVLGWSWLFAPYYWHFEARALEPTNAIFLYGTRLREQCAADPDLGYELIKRVAQVLVHRLQAASRQLVTARASRSARCEAR